MSAYVVIEGPDGSGKSTLTAALAKVLRERGLRVAETRHPGGTEFGARLRAILKDASLSPPPLARRLLFAADRLASAPHIADLLRDHDVVLCDRCSEISDACYAVAEGCDAGDVLFLRSLCASQRRPDVVLLVDTPSDLADGWLKRGTEARDPAERDPELLARVRASYAALIDAAREHGFVLASAGAGHDGMPARAVDGGLRDPESMARSAAVELCLGGWLGDPEELRP